MLSKVAAGGGECARAECDRMFELIGKMGIGNAGEPDAMIGDDPSDDVNDAFIQSNAAA